MFKNINDKSNPDNLRPIAQLFPISKVYESLIMKQLTEQLESQNIIDPCQFSFQQGHSTIHPLMITSLLFGIEPLPLKTSRMVLKNIIQN